MMRGRDLRTCTRCAAAWPARTSRYCGSCGTPLGPATAAARAGARPTARIPVVLAVAVLAGAIGPANPALEPPSSDRETVELPESTAASDHGLDARLTGRCVPDGCLRWFAPVGSGVVAVADDAVFHLGRRRLVALDPDHGSVRWDVAVEGPDGAGAPAGGGLDVVDELVIHRGHRWIRAHEAATGTTRFTTGLVPQRFPRSVMRMRDGLVVTGALHADHRGSPYEFVALLDDNDGRIRWSSEVHRVWVAPYGIVGDAPADRQSVIDPGDGRLRIRVPVEEVWHDPDTIVVQPTRDVVAVLHPHDGTPRWQRVVAEVMDHGGVELLLERDGRLEVVDLATGRRRTGAAVPDEDALPTLRAVDRDGDDLHLTGPGATVVVPGPARVASVEPLLVSTADGLLAVDMGALVGTPR